MQKPKMKDLKNKPHQVNDVDAIMTFIGMASDVNKTMGKHAEKKCMKGEDDEC